MTGTITGSPERVVGEAREAGAAPRAARPGPSRPSARRPRRSGSASSAPGWIRNRTKVGSFVSARTWNRALSTTVDRAATSPAIAVRDRLVEPVALLAGPRLSGSPGSAGITSSSNRVMSRRTGSAAATTPWSASSPTRSRIRGVSPATVAVTSTSSASPIAGIRSSRRRRRATRTLRHSALPRPEDAADPDVGQLPPGQERGEDEQQDDRRRRPAAGCPSGITTTGAGTGAAPVWVRVVNGSTSQARSSAEDDPGGEPDDEQEQALDRQPPRQLAGRQAERPEQGELAEPLVRRDGRASRGTRSPRRSSRRASRGRGSRSARAARDRCVRLAGQLLPADDARRVHAGARGGRRGRHGSAPGSARSHHSSACWTSGRWRRTAPGRRSPGRRTAHGFARIERGDTGRRPDDPHGRTSGRRSRSGRSSPTDTPDWARNASEATTGMAASSPAVAAPAPAASRNRVPPFAVAEDRRALAGRDEVRPVGRGRVGHPARSPSVRSQCQPVVAPLTATGDQPASPLSLSVASSPSSSAEPLIGSKPAGQIDSSTPTTASGDVGRTSRRSRVREVHDEPLAVAGERSAARPRSGTAVRRRRAGRRRRSARAIPAAAARSRCLAGLAGRSAASGTPRRDVEREPLRVRPGSAPRARRRCRAERRPAGRSSAPAADASLEPAATRRPSRRRIEPDERPVADRPPDVERTPSLTGVAAATPGIARYVGPARPRRQRRVVAGHDPDVGRRLPRRLVLPASGARSPRATAASVPERGREHQEEGRPGVAERPAGELAAAERRRRARGRGRGTARSSSAIRGTTRRARTAPAISPIAGAATSSGSSPSAPRALTGQRRAVQPELPERDDRDRHEREVEAEPLRQASSGPGGASAARAPAGLAETNSVGRVRTTTAGQPGDDATTSDRGPADRRRRR